MIPYVRQISPSCIIIYADDGVYLQSYNKIIACKCEDGRIFIDEIYWDYSKTTGKCRNNFLNETKKETEKKLRNGIYQLKDLNQEL